MKADLFKRVSKKQFAKACRENNTIIGVCRALDIRPMQAYRLERVYNIDLPREHAFQKFDHDKIYETYLKNDCKTSKTAKIIGCHIATVSNVVKKYEEDTG